MKIKHLLFALVTAALASGCVSVNNIGLGPSSTETYFQTWKTISSGGKEIRLVKIRLEEIGLTQSASTMQGPEPTSGMIYKAAVVHGLQACTAQEAQDLRSEYTDQPAGEFLILLGKPDASGNMTMPIVGSYPVWNPGVVNLWLSPLTTSVGGVYNYNYPDMHWYVFKK